MKTSKRSVVKIIIIVLAVLILGVTAFFLSPVGRSIINKKAMNGLAEYSRYVSEDERYTVSVRDNSPAGLFGGVKLRVYLIDSKSGRVSRCGDGRIDYYEDFSSGVFFNEDDNGITVSFKNKYSTHEIYVNKTR